MAKLKNIISWTLGLVALILMMSFGQRKANEIRLEQPGIHIDHHSGFYFVQEGEIEDIVRSQYPIYDSLRLNEINIALLEESLDNHPSILKSEVYSDFNGRVMIDIVQQKPIARILRSNNSYYLTNQGDSMALSKNYSAEVPLLTGAINRNTRAQVFQFLQKIDEDAYFRESFSGIHIHENNRWELYPKKGHHKILFGSPTNVDKKLKKLKTFYQTIVDESMLKEIKRIDLQFTNQVICQKYENS
jgi:cell division protein FtsQ